MSYYPTWTASLYQTHESNRITKSSNWPRVEGEPHAVEEPLEGDLVVGDEPLGHEPLLRHRHHLGVKVVTKCYKVWPAVTSCDQLFTYVTSWLQMWPGDQWCEQLLPWCPRTRRWSRAPPGSPRGSHPPPRTQPEEIQISNHINFKGWKKEAMFGFFSADSKTNQDQKSAVQQLPNMFLFAPHAYDNTVTIGYCVNWILWWITFCYSLNKQLMIQKYCKMSGYCDKLLIATLLPFPNSVAISDYHCIFRSWGDLP